MSSRSLLPLLLALLPSTTFAHNLDCNGNSQPAVILSGCCGREDYLALRPDEVRPDGPGWDVYVDNSWHRAIHPDGQWILAQPTLAACWGVWYRRGTRTGPNIYYYDHSGNTNNYTFYCLEQPATE